MQTAVLQDRGSWLSLVLLVILTIGCPGGEPARQPLTAELPLHLEEHLDTASIEGAEIPTEVSDSIAWSFSEGELEWKALDHFSPALPPPQIEQIEDALRISLSEAHRDSRGDRLHGDIYVALPELKRGDWSHVLVRARASEKIRNLGIGFNLRSQADAENDEGPYVFGGDRTPVVNDGTIQTYRFRADWSPRSQGDWEDPWNELGLAINAGEQSIIDILSVTLVPKGERYADASVGVRSEVRSHAQRRAMFTHVPGGIEYRVRLPEAARLDVGVGVLRNDVPVTFRITAAFEGGGSETLLEETYGDREHWGQRSVDLSALAGRTASLTLEVDAEKTGTVAFWAAPTVSGGRTGAKPNVIFYVLDGGGADYMSVYGYNRRTTPNFERLAAEGAAFEHARGRGFRACLQ